MLMKDLEIVRAVAAAGSNVTITKEGAVIVSNSPKHRCSPGCACPFEERARKLLAALIAEEQSEKE